MYFIKFSKGNIHFDGHAGKTVSFKEFDNKGKALRWLFDNGYEAAIPKGADPYNANIFWSAEQQQTVAGCGS